VTNPRSEPADDPSRPGLAEGRLLQRFDFKVGELAYTSTIVESDWVPPDHLITAALAFVVEGDRLLLARIRARAGRCLSSVAKAGSGSSVGGAAQWAAHLRTCWPPGLEPNSPTVSKRARARIARGSTRRPRLVARDTAGAGATVWRCGRPGSLGRWPSSRSVRRPEPPSGGARDARRAPPPRSDRCPPVSGVATKRKTAASSGLHGHVRHCL
jgi:hypothetical protein